MAKHWDGFLSHYRNFPAISIHFFFQSIDIFVDELRWEETDVSKCDKIRALKLNNEEWHRVNVFLGLLSVCLQYILVVDISDTLQSCRQFIASILFSTRI